MLTLTLNKRRVMQVFTPSVHGGAYHGYHTGFHTAAHTLINGGPTHDYTEVRKPIQVSIQVLKLVSTGILKCPNKC